MPCKQMVLKPIEKTETERKNGHQKDSSTIGMLSKTDENNPE